MNLQARKALDYYAGGLGMALLRPLVWLSGRLLRRDHTPEVRGSLCVVKMLGGGNLVIAYPALLGLRLRHPDATLSLITVREVRPFADSLGVFDRVGWPACVLGIALSLAGAAVLTRSLQLPIDRPARVRASKM